MADKNTVMQHVEWAVLMITILGAVYTMDSKVERQIAVQSARTDQLYKMYCEIRDDNHKMWSETQKEIKDLYITNHKLSGSS